MKYIKPEIKYQKFDCESILTASTIIDGGETDDFTNYPGFDFDSDDIDAMMK